MDFTSKSHRQFIEDRLQEVRQQLLQREPALMQDFLELLALQAVLDGRTAGTIVTPEFAGYRRAIQAILVLLQRTGRPMSPDEIARAVVDGGWAPLDKRRRYNVIDSIRHHTKPGKPLILVDGMVALNPDYKPKPSSSEDADETPDANPEAAEDSTN